MLRAMDSAVAGLRAHQNKMDVVGHNIANVNTLGFKAQTYTFKDAMYQTSTASTGNDPTTKAGGVNAAQYGYGTLMGTIGMDMTASTPSYTGGFNATIDGQGFFITMSTPDATASSDTLKTFEFDYTRVGQFSVDSAGFVVDGNGHYVYGYQATNPSASDSVVSTATTQMKPLRAPASLTGAGSADPTADVLKLDSVQIDQNGMISASVDDNGTAKTVYLGRVAIATFQNPEGLSKVGNNYYRANQSDNTGVATATPPGGATASLMPGYLEASNVDLAKEFADMITTHRGFQANSKMITVSDEMLSDLVAMKR